MTETAQELIEMARAAERERERCARACEGVAANRPTLRVAALECSKVIRSLGDAK